MKKQKKEWKYFLGIFVVPGIIFFYLSLYYICPYVEWTECKYPRKLCEYPGFCDIGVFSSEIKNTEFRYIIRSRGFGFFAGDLFSGEDPLFYTPYTNFAPNNNREIIKPAKIDITDGLPLMFYKGTTVIMLTNNKDRAIEFFDSKIFNNWTSCIWVFYKRNWEKK